MKTNNEILYWSVTGLGTAIAATSSKENALKFAAIAVVARLMERYRHIEYKTEKNTYYYKYPILQTCRKQAMNVAAVAFASPAIIAFLKDKSPLSAFMCTVVGSAFAHTIFGDLPNKALNFYWVPLELMPRMSIFAFLGQCSKFYNNDGTLKGLFMAGSTRYAIGTVNFLQHNTNSHFSSHISLDEKYEDLDQDNERRKYRAIISEKFCQAGLQFMLYGIPNYLSSLSPQFSATYTSLGVIGKIATATLIECKQTSEFLTNVVTKCFNGAQKLSHGRSPF